MKRRKLMLALFWASYIAASIFIMIFLPWVAKDQFYFVISTQIVYLAGLAFYGSKIIEFATGLKIVKQGEPKPPMMFFIVVFYRSRNKPRELHFETLDKALKAAIEFYFNDPNLIITMVTVYQYKPVGTGWGAEIVKEFKPIPDSDLQ